MEMEVYDSPLSEDGRTEKEERERERERDRETREGGLEWEA